MFLRLPVTDRSWYCHGEQFNILYPSAQLTSIKSNTVLDFTFVVGEIKLLQILLGQDILSFAWMFLDYMF